MRNSKEYAVGTARYFLCTLLSDNFCISDYITSVVNVLTWGDGGTLLRFQVTGSHCTATTSLQWHTIAWRSGHGPILNEFLRAQLKSAQSLRWSRNLQNKNNHCRIFRNPPLHPILSMPLHLIHLPSKPRTPMWLFQLKISDQNFVPSSHVPCVLHRVLIPKRVIAKASVKTPM
jgi:hypothetical protein